jgi:DNA-binding NarL/FixJ family response regulator
MRPIEVHPTAQVARVRVIIGEDTWLVRHAMEQILARARHIELVRSCGDRDSLLAAVESERPDVVVTDIRMPPTGTDEGIDIARRLHTEHPSIGVVLLSQFADPAYVLAFLESGSSGRAYLLKERVGEASQVVDAIETVAVGGSVIDPSIVDVLVRARRLDRQGGLSDLTPRELEVLSEIAQGKSNAAIASSLVLTKRAIERHINAIFTKLELGNPNDVSRRVKATLLFLASGRQSEELL